MRANPNFKQSVVENTTNEQKNVVHNVIISDASGSMSGSKYTTSCKSIKDEIDVLSKDSSVIYKFSLIEFNSRRTVKHLWLEENFNKNVNFISAGYSTPLYQTIGSILTELEKTVKPDERVLIKIFTDGDDTTYDKGEWKTSNTGIYLNKLINVNNWTITFNCTEQDKKKILRLNIPESNILCHNNTAEDIERVSNERLKSTIKYMKSVSMNVSSNELKTNFYSKSL